jgi:hypothetical protein
MSGFFSYVEFNVAIAAYFAPLIIAVARKIPNRGPVIVADVFLGWTVVGWVVALAMACRSQRVPVSLPPRPAPWMTPRSGSYGGRR